MIPEIMAAIPFPLMSSVELSLAPSLTMIAAVILRWATLPVVAGVLLNGRAGKLLPDSSEAMSPAGSPA